MTMDANKAAACSTPGATRLPAHLEVSEEAARALGIEPGRYIHGPGGSIGPLPDDPSEIIAGLPVDFRPAPVAPILAPVAIPRGGLEGDEREALAERAIRAADKADECGRPVLEAWPDGVEFTSGDLRALAAGFHRSEVAKPSAKIEFPFTHNGVTLEPDDGGVWISMLHQKARWIGPNALAAIKASGLLARPQGRPAVTDQGESR